MKNPRILFLCLMMLCFSSCVDIEERYDFNADGSVKVVYGFDMSRAVSVLMNLMTDSIRQTPQFGMAKDTTLNFYTALPDSTRLKMLPDEINIAQGSELAVKMDLNKNIMRVNVNHLAKNTDELEYYLKHISKISLSNPVNNIAKNNKNIQSFNGQQLVAGQDYYDYDVTPHKFYRIIDKDKFNAFLKKTGSTFAMAKAMLIDMPYKLVLNFSKPVKKVVNPRAILSPDKKTVTILADMNDVIKDPSLMNIKIDF
ncbi:MAG: hypothetical protein EOP47_05840 [Sphingobacteriaceae bacterium]|nr:MAG: hypothetical protein EOP47_05840 [Sphingobacteriaceae bacterium]